MKPITIVLAAALALPGAALAQTCEGGAYLNPQLFRGEAAHQITIAEQELRGFLASSGLPTQPLYPIKRIDDVTASGRACPARNSFGHEIGVNRRVWKKSGKC